MGALSGGVAFCCMDRIPFVQEAGHLPEAVPYVRWIRGSDNHFLSLVFCLDVPICAQESITGFLVSIRFSSAVLSCFHRLLFYGNMVGHALVRSSIIFAVLFIVDLAGSEG